MTEPRGHHLLPRTYQRGFANEQEQVRIFDRSTGNAFTTSMTNAFKRRDWNAIPDADGRLDHAAELMLSEHVDSPASPGLQQLREGNVVLSEEDRLGVAMFVTAQTGRTPSWRSSVDKFHVEVAERMLSLAAQHLSDDRWEEITGERPTKAMRERIMSGKAFTIAVEKSDLGVSLDVARDLAPFVAAMSWTIVEFDEPWLFSSGLPVLHLARTPPPPMIGLGFGTADATYVPLSPTRALWLRPTAIRDPKQRDRVITAGRATARKLNYRMLIAPTSEQLLMSPDTAEHPLPASLQQTGFPTELMWSS